MFSGFQSSMAQNNAFQIVASQVAPRNDPNGNLLKGYVPYGFELARYERAERLEQLRLQEIAARQDLYSQELRIEELELKRLREGLADRQLQIELLALLNEQYQIKYALARYASEMRELLLEEEAIMVIMLTMEF